MSVFEGLTRDPRSARRAAGVLLAATFIGLIPWIVYLALALPVHHRTTHWDTVWVGFDCLLATAVGLTLISLWRRSQYLPVTAACLGALLIADAWFDVSSAGGGSELTESLLWLILELPLAAFSFWMATWSVREPEEARQALNDVTSLGRRDGTLGRR
jgi:hypothetical protein